MGQKVHPYGFRLGIIRQSKSRWFAEGQQYRDYLIEDIKMRNYIKDVLNDASISDIVIERAGGTATITIQTAKPGIVIGRAGQDVDRLRRKLESMTTMKVRVNVEETREPDINAQLIAENIARQIERRVSYRRAMRQAIERAMRMGAEGTRCIVSGRLGGAEIARSESAGPEGRVPLQTLRADVEYGFAEAHTGYGHIGCKVWVYKGDILPKKPEPQPEEITAEPQPDEITLETEEAAETEPAAEVASTQLAAAPAAEDTDTPAEAADAETEETTAPAEDLEIAEPETANGVTQDPTDSAPAEEPETEQPTEEPVSEADTKQETEEDPLVAALQGDDETETAGEEPSDANS